MRDGESDQRSVKKNYITYYLHYITRLHNGIPSNKKEEEREQEREEEWEKENIKSEGINVKVRLSEATCTYVI